MIRTELIRPLPELLDHHARTCPDHIAFVDDRRRVSYAELDAGTARLAGHLADLGLAPGDRALVLLANSVRAVQAYLAVPRAGGVAVCVNPRSAPTEVAHILRDSGATVVITDAARLDTVRALLTGTALTPVVVSVDPPPGAEPEVHDWAELLATPATSAPRDCLALDDVAWMLYTSGTTGRPKGVHLTQRGCLWVVAACWAPILGLGPDDVMLCPLPLYHSYALDLCVLGVLAVGATQRILPRFSPTAVLRALSGGGCEGRVTVLPGVPTMFHYLLREAAGAGGTEPRDTASAGGTEPREAGQRPDTGPLRLCVSAGAILPAALNIEFERVFDVPLLDGYGITETSTMVTMNWPTGTRVMGSCGLPLPGLAVRLVDPGSGTDAPPGGEGEVWVRGPNVTPGYHNLPEATAAALADGWYHTGDLARADEHGFLTISGRTKELIIRGGENVYPAEVEDALLACSGVADAAVVGVPHDGLGEVPVAFVVPAEASGVDADAVLARCEELLTDFKVPTRLVEIEEIPRTGSGKILRFRLREKLIGGG